MSFLGWDSFNRRYTVSLVADNGGGADPLAEGSGEVMRIWFGIDPLELGGITATMTAFDGTHTLKAMTNGKEYPPAVMAGSVGTRYVLRGDLNHDYTVNVSDMTYLISHLFSGGPAPVTVQAGDVNNDQEVNVQDMTYLIAYLFSGGPAPVTP